MFYGNESLNSQLARIPKLVKIYNNVKELPQIKAYENSSKAFKIASPT